MISIDLNKIVCFILIIVSSFFGQAQEQVTLRFTGQNQNGDYVALSSVVVENITQHWQEVLYYSDTTLNIELTGIGEFAMPDGGVRLFQNVPNPFDGVTDFALQVPRTSQVQLEIYDLNGKLMATYQGPLDAGCHRFRAWLSAPQTYLLQARFDGGIVQIKLVNTGSGGQNRMEYIGNGNALTVENLKSDPRGNTTMPFNYGDTMSYTGYAQIANTPFTSAVVKKAQYASELIPLTFTLPLPTVTTEAASNISTTKAQLNGSITGVTEYPILERGFELADNINLTGAVTYTDSTVGGVFHLVVSNLQLATQYFYRAYCQTAMGVAYGNVVDFVTQAELPEVHTLSVTGAGTHWANCSSDVTFHGGAYVTARGICWSTAQDPTLSDNHTSDGNGTGTFTSNITGLDAGTTYYVRAYATNSVGTAYGEQLNFTTLPPFNCGIDTVIDYDGNVYQTVAIGTQCWMRENLRTTHFPDGAVIPDGSNAAPSMYNSYRYSPNGDSLNIPVRGYLYNWSAVMHGAASSNANPSGVRGVCPFGWHLPSKAEFDQLVNYLGGQSQYVCGEDNRNVAKALASTTEWQLSSYYCAVGTDPLTNNASGFTAFPTGGYSDGVFTDIQTSTSFWSSTQIVLAGNYGAYQLRIVAQESETNIFGLGKRCGNSVRCLRD